MSETYADLLSLAWIGTKGQGAFVATIIALGIIWSFVRGGELLAASINATLY